MNLTSLPTFVNFETTDFNDTSFQTNLVPFDLFLPIYLVIFSPSSLNFLDILDSITLFRP